MRQSLSWGIVLSFALMASCAGFGQNLSYTPDPNWKAPASVAARVNPLAKKPEAAAGGKKLFLRECVECHGEQGWGLEKKHSADLQSPVVQSQSDGVLFWKVTNGNPDRGMPSFSRLPEMQRWQIVLFVRSLATKAQPESTEGQAK